MLATASTVTLTVLMLKVVAGDMASICEMLFPLYSGDFFLLGGSLRSVSR